MHTRPVVHKCLPEIHRLVRIGWYRNCVSGCELETATLNFRVWFLSRVGSSLTRSLTLCAIWPRSVDQRVTCPAMSYAGLPVTDSVRTQEICSIDIWTSLIRGPDERSDTVTR